MSLERISTRSLGYQPQQTSIIIVMYALVEERISHWNIVKTQYTEVECVAVKKTK